MINEQCDCPRCREQDSASQAERLLTMVRAVLYPKNEITEFVDTGEAPHALALIKTAMDLSKQSARFKLRAMVEDWDLQRIIREMY